MGKVKHVCRQCGEDITERWAIGYKFCMDCNANYEALRAKSRCVVAPHKQGYMFFTDEVAKDIVKGINNKGGLVK